MLRIRSSRVHSSFPTLVSLSAMVLAATARRVVAFTSSPSILYVNPNKKAHARDVCSFLIWRSASRRNSSVSSSEQTGSFGLGKFSAIPIHLLLIFFLMEQKC